MKTIERPTLDWAHQRFLSTWSPEWNLQSCWSVPPGGDRPLLWCRPFLPGAWVCVRPMKYSRNFHTFYFGRSRVTQQKRPKWRPIWSMSRSSPIVCNTFRSKTALLLITSSRVPPMADWVYGCWLILFSKRMRHNGGRFNSTDASRSGDRREIWSVPIPRRHFK